MRVLVTGASGYLGDKAVGALVKRGIDVTGVGRSPAPRSHGIRWHQADLLDPSAARAVVESVRPTHILHLAWYVEHGKFWQAAQNLAWVGATLNLATAAVASGCRRFVGIGTCYEYDWPEDADCDEGVTPVAPNTLYGTAKDATRRVLEAWCRQEGCEFAWGRLFFPYGAGESPNRLVPSLARALLRGEEAKCSSGLVYRDFIEIRDVAEALASLLVASVDGAVNIGSGEAVRIRDIAQKLARLAGREDLLKIGALPDRPFDPPRVVASVDRLRHDVGFIPSVSLDEGLAAALDYWKEAP